MTEPAHIELPDHTPTGRPWRPGRGFIAGAAVLAAALAGVAAIYAYQGATSADAVRQTITARTAARVAAAAPHTVTFQANSGAHDAFIIDATGTHDRQPVGQQVTTAGVVLVEVVAVSTGQTVSCTITVDGAVVDREQAPAGPAAFTICTWRPGQTQ